MEQHDAEYCGRHAAVAGMIIAALAEVQRLNLQEMTPEAVVVALCVSRSQAYEWAARIRRWISTRPGPGRPRASRRGADAQGGMVERSLRLCKAIRDWLLYHPGSAVAGRKRTTYTDAFRAFIVDLLVADGAAAEMTRAAVADAVGVREDTLARWLSPCMACDDTTKAEEDGATVVMAPAEATAASDSEAAKPAGAPAPQPTASSSPDAPEAAATACASSDESTAAGACSSAAGQHEVDAPAPAALPATQSPGSAPVAVELPTAAWADPAARIRELWKSWKGTKQAFLRSLANHGLHYSPGLVRSILTVSQLRPIRARRPKYPDAEATRGTLERVDPNTQWMEDGSPITVAIGDQLYRPALQIFVDNCSGALTGTSARDHEDSQGFLDGLDQGRQSTGRLPLAVLRDGRKCNTAARIERALEQADVVSIYGTKGRPQSNALAENEFRHIKRTLPPLVLPDVSACTREELARNVAELAVLCYKAGRNETPRSRLDGRTPAQVLAGHVTTVERQAEQRDKMRRLQRRLLDEGDSEARRNREAALQLLGQTFTELNMQDPNNHIIPRIARYGLEAVIEAIGVVKARRQAGTLPDAHPERFLLSTTRRIAYRNQDTRVFEHLLDLRIKAGQLILVPLEDELRRLRSELAGDDFLKAVLHRATYSLTAADRIFWRRTFMAHFDRLPAAQRIEKGRWAAARLAGRLRMPYLERQYFLSLIARSAVPLVA